MDPRLIDYYNNELAHVREMGAEFAREFPKVAARLGMEGVEVADPYVERLLEGFAFIAARVQLKTDAEFPRFTQHLLEMLFPQYLAPMPSCMLVEMKPDPGDPLLLTGFPLARWAMNIATHSKSPVCDRMFTTTIMPTSRNITSRST